MNVTCTSCGRGYFAGAQGARCPGCGTPHGGWGGGWAGPAPQGAPVGQAPYVAAQPVPYGGAPMAELDVTTMIIVAVIVVVFCQPAGIVAFIFIDQAKTMHRQGNFEGAQEKLGHAKLAMWIGGGLMGLIILAYLAMFLVVFGMAASSRP